MSKISVLIVEDESIVALELKKELIKLGCNVIDIVKTKKDVFNSIEKIKPNIILMDINLGKKENGIEIAKEIKQTQNIAILYLSAFSDEITLEKAFSTNPLGYIVKPFKIQELKTHIELALYKLKQNSVNNINEDYTSLGEEFYFDTKNNQLYYRDIFIKLGTKEKILLSVLVEANNAPVSFSKIKDILWQGYDPSDSTLRTLVYRLKGKLGNNIIEVTHGYGYNLKVF